MALVILAQRRDLDEVAVAAELHQNLQVAQRAPHVVADAQRGQTEATGKTTLRPVVVAGPILQHKMRKNILQEKNI